MTCALTKIAAGCASVVMLMGATAASASASYLGYANGDPANWDFYMEQHNGVAAPDESAMPPRADYYNATVVRHHRPIHGHLRMETRPRRDYE